MKRFRSPHLHAAAWVVTVTALMMMPAEALPEMQSWLPLDFDRWIDKVQHVFAFAVMVVLLARSFEALERVRRALPSAALTTLGFSYALEALQLLLPWRNFDPLDLWADTVGVLIGLPIARYVAASIRSRRAPG